MSRPERIKALEKRAKVTISESASLYLTMKFAVALLSLAAVAQAGLLAPLTGGSSSVSRSEDGLGNYAFSYNEGHATGGTFRSESGAPGAVRGSYGLRDADGRVRTVNYVADAAGYRASISTNEPGVEAKNPADVSINAAGPIVAAAPLIAAAPAPLVATHHHYAAPAPLWAGQVNAPIAAAPWAYTAQW